VNEYDAMLRAIYAEPDEDTPRLALADWLEEREEQVECGACMRDGAIYIWKCKMCKNTRRVSNGNAARAEFIRCQIAVERWVQVGTAEEGGEAGAALARSQELNINCPKWLGVAFSGMAEWSRGFVSSITLPCAAFMQHARAIFESQPVTTCTISDFPAWQYEGEPGRWRIGGGGSCENLPWPIWDLVVGRSELYPFYSEAEALMAQSDAFVDYGRSLANLPPLRRAEPVTAHGGAGVLVNEREG
jgi:uncharacterized protein (TIGR02996 family)